MTSHCFFSKDMPASVCHSGRDDLRLYEQVLALSNQVYPAFLEALLKALPRKPPCIVYGERSHDIVNSAPFSGVRKLVTIVNLTWLVHPLRQRIRWLSPQESDNILHYLFLLISLLLESAFQDPSGLSFKARRALLWAADSDDGITRRPQRNDPENIVRRFSGDVGELCINSVQSDTVFKDGVPVWYEHYVRDPANNTQIPHIQRTINAALREGESLNILFGLWGCNNSQCDDNTPYLGLYGGMCSCTRHARHMRTSVDGEGDVFIAIVGVCDRLDCGGYALFNNVCKRCGTLCRTIDVPNNWTSKRKHHSYFVHKFENGKFVGSLGGEERGGTNEIVNDVRSACEGVQLQSVPSFLKNTSKFSRVGPGLKSFTPLASKPNDLGRSTFGEALLKHLKNGKRFDGEFTIGTTQYVSVGPYNSTQELMNIWS